MRALVIAAAIVLAPSATSAQTREITPFVGWQEGGSISVNNDQTSIDGSTLGGLMVSFERSPNTMLDFVFSHQSSDVASGDFPDEFRIDDVAVNYLHVGGRYMFGPGERFNPYIAATAGGTRVAAAGEYAAGFSFAGGVGVDIDLSRALALRLDGRYYTTLGNSSTIFACAGEPGAGECSFLTEGQQFNQFAASAGLVIRF